MTRTDNVKRNLVFNILKYIVQMILQFVIRTVLIYKLGVEYIGLNGLFANIFSFLNLAELGIGTAIVFSMYKPIAEGDNEKVRALQNLYKKFYLIIGSVVLLFGLVLTPFLKYFIKDEVTANINIYILYVMYLLNTLSSYFCAHKRSLLFAYQRNDVENKIRTLCIIIMSIIQIFVLLLFENYYLYFSITIIFSIIECLWIYSVAKKLYPQINGKAIDLDTETKKEISKNVSALSLHKIGSAVVFSTDNILISMFCGIVILGVYSNYALIINAILSIFGILQNALLGSIGNMVASQSNSYTYSRFKVVNCLFVYFSTFTTICLLTLFQPFMQMWTGGDIYLLNMSTVMLICLSFYLSRMRTSVFMFKDAAGLFWQNRWMPIVESIVNLVVSVGFGLIMGINGIFIGTIVSTLVAPFWVEPYVLYKHYFKRGVWEYFKRYMLDALIMLASATICYFVCSFIPDGGVLWLIVKFAVCIVLSNVLLILAYLPTKEFRELLATGKNVLKGLFKKKEKRLDRNNDLT